MFIHHNLSPIIFQIGPVALRWYGFMYAVGFYVLATVMRRQSLNGFMPLSTDLVEKLFFWLVIGLLVGARVFYVVFYGTETLWRDPLEMFAIWHGGLSFHGGLTGVALVSFLMARKAKISWVSILDTLALCGPIGIGLGRIGNFINGELFGRVSSVPWAMIFKEGGPLARHPSQLYEAGLEGLLLGSILWVLKSRVKRHGIIISVFMILYPVFRIFAEFFREPDPQLGFIFGPFTMGQILSVFVFIPGLVFYFYSVKRGPLI